MSKELFISSTPHETKVAIVEDDQLAEIYYERENEYTLAGSIYKGRVTRVLPGMQSAFVNIGLERDAFLYVSDFLLEEEEEEVDGLEQVVSRGRVIESPGPDDASQGHQSPLEADELIPPAEQAEGNEGREPSAGESSPGAEATESSSAEEDRGGARKWRGRRRRRGGRGRFQEREERGSERPAEKSAESPAGEAPQPAQSESTAAVRAEAAPQPERSRGRGEDAPVLLPGESISKYQPHGDKPAQAPAPKRRTNAIRPSTEYSLNSAEFSPDSMVLPGESISKYRRERPAVEEHRGAPFEQHGVMQDVESAGPVPREMERQAHHEHREQDRPSAKDAARQVEALRAPGEAVEPHRPEQERFERMNVASTFGGEATETEAESTIEESAADVPEVAAAAATPAPEGQPRSASGGGVMEEEEIEEEEIELPGFEEEDADLAEYEELEEEVLGSGSDQLVAAGSELTEAVRDAHINERATGQYEAEGLEASETEEGREMFGVGEEREDDDEALEAVQAEAEAEAAGEGLEGARAEHRAAAGTAGYQQAQRSDRRGDRRGGRRPGRRPMRGRRYHEPRRLPAISDLLKEGQEILVQIAKEPIAKKGARITSHIALPGRFLVYMPTVHHTGVSRKIASEEERHRLKRIVLSERGEAHGGFIVRTAAAGANEDDLRADIRFLINLWNEIRGRAETSKAPALIYHDLNLVERILRDQVTTSFSAIWVDTEQEYERILRFVSRFQPSMLKRVKLYSKETPLFEQFSISDEINKALKSKVWLKSGGYIVINQTEALVAIDINTGKYVGKTARLEDTIVKTNIDAIREIVRQIRLRDLGGIIVIDFIDMDERKNRHKVMQALEDALKADRAPSKVLQFNDFGLVAITRKRVKQSLERTLGQPCPICQATGMIKSVTTVCNEIYVEMRKMSRHFERDVMLRVNPEVAKALKANGGKWIQEMEELTKQNVIVKSDPLLHPEHFDIQ
jgi:Rne/Rng family ribonuclease